MYAELIMLLDGILSLIIFLMAVITHEIGHMIAFSLYGMKPKVKFNINKNGFIFKFETPKEFTSLAPQNKIMIYIFGVGLGWLFFWGLNLRLKISIIFMIFWGLIYIIGSKNDIHNICRLWKELD